MLTIRQLLVIEDKPEENNNYTEACKLAAKELSKIGLAIEADVKQAFNLSQANEYLEKFKKSDSDSDVAQTEKLSVVSIDMALDQKEEHITTERRDAGQEVSGILILQRVEDMKPQPLAIVVTGEESSSISVDAFQTYHVFGFFQKSRMRIGQYRNAIKAALLYAEAIDIIENAKRLQTQNSDINTAKSYWDSAVQSAKEVKISEKNFPINVATKIKDEFVDKNTGFSKNIWARQILLSKVVGYDRTGWAFLQINITTQDDSYFGYILKRDLGASFFELANIIRDALEQVTLLEYSIVFIDTEYLSKPSILLVANSTDADRLQQIAGKVEKVYKKRASVFDNMGKAIEIANEQRLHVSDVKEKMRLVLKLKLVDSSGYSKDVSYDGIKDGIEPRYIDPFYVWDDLINEIEV